MKISLFLCSALLGVISAVTFSPPCSAPARFPNSLQSIAPFQATPTSGLMTPQERITRERLIDQGIAKIVAESKQNSDTQEMREARQYIHTYPNTPFAADIKANLDEQDKIKQKGLNLSLWFMMESKRYLGSQHLPEFKNLTEGFEMQIHRLENKWEALSRNIAQIVKAIRAQGGQIPVVTSMTGSQPYANMQSAITQLVPGNVDISGCINALQMQANQIHQVMQQATGQGVGQVGMGAMQTGNMNAVPISLGDAQSIPNVNWQTGQQAATEASLAKQLTKQQQEEAENRRIREEVKAQLIKEELAEKRKMMKLQLQMEEEKKKRALVEEAILKDAIEKKILRELKQRKVAEKLNDDKLDRAQKAIERLEQQKSKELEEVTKKLEKIVEEKVKEAAQAKAASVKAISRTAQKEQQMIKKIANTEKKIKKSLDKIVSKVQTVKPVVPKRPCAVDDDEDDGDDVEIECEVEAVANEQVKAAARKARIAALQKANLSPALKEKKIASEKTKQIKAEAKVKAKAIKLAAKKKIRQMKQQVKQVNTKQVKRVTKPQVRTQKATTAAKANTTPAPAGKTSTGVVIPPGSTVQPACSLNLPSCGSIAQK